MFPSWWSSGIHCEFKARESNTNRIVPSWWGIGPKSSTQCPPKFPLWFQKLLRPLGVSQLQLSTCMRSKLVSGTSRLQKSFISPCRMRGSIHCSLISRSLSLVELVPRFQAVFLLILWYIMGRIEHSDRHLAHLTVCQCHCSSYKCLLFNVYSQVIVLPVLVGLNS